MSVFDAACGQNLLAKDHTVDYVPQSLASLQRLARAQAQTIARVDELVAHLRPVAELDLEAFGPSTRIRRALEGLSAETRLDRLRDAATVTPEMVERRDALARQVAEIDGRTADTSARSAEQAAERLDRLAVVLEQTMTQLGPTAVRAASVEHAAVAAAEALLSQMSASQFESEPVSGVGTEPWRVLWRAAETFVHEIHGAELPDDHDGARCPLCMQDLSDDALARMARFAAFVRSDAERQLATARAVVERRRFELPDIERLREAHDEALRECAARAPLQAALEPWLESAAATAARLVAGSDASPPVGPAPIAAIRALAEERRAVAVQLGALQDPGREAALRDELAELRAAEALAARLDSIERRLLDLKRIARLERAKRELNTTTVSTRLRVMASAFVTDELESALHRHLDELNFRDVHVVGCTTSGREGHPRVGLKIKAKGKVPLRQVLSDGEQRRLALAFFLAEVSVGTPGQPVVLDDPVCSVDHQGRRHIARTLVRAARERQVIVFTHELTFLEELVAAAASVGVPLHQQHVVTSGGSSGRVQIELPWDGAKAGTRSKRLRNDLIALDKLHRTEPEGEAYANESARIAVRLRQAFERAVEDEVVGGVVKRGDPAVHISQLRDVAWSQEVYEMAKRGLDDNSPWAHDRSRASNASPPTPAELRDGVDLLDLLLDATAAIRKMRSKQPKQWAPVPGGPSAPGDATAALRPQLPGISSDAA
jgi:hypothetical protein